MSLRGDGGPKGFRPESPSVGESGLVFKRFFGQYETVRKIVIGILGLSVLLVGALMILLPGPAIVVIPAGLAILATEFGWARAILVRLKKKLQWVAKDKETPSSNSKK